MLETGGAVGGGGGGEVVYSSRTLPVMDVFEVTRDAVVLLNLATMWSPLEIVLVYLSNTLPSTVFCQFLSKQSPVRMDTERFDTGTYKPPRLNHLINKKPR